MASSTLSTPFKCSGQDMSTFDCFSSSRTLDWESFLTPDDRLYDPTVFNPEELSAILSKQSSNFTMPEHLQTVEPVTQAASSGDVAWGSLFKAFVKSYAHLFSVPQKVTIEETSSSAIQSEAARLPPEPVRHSPISNECPSATILSQIACMPSEPVLSSPVSSVPEPSFFDSDTDLNSDCGLEEPIKSPRNPARSRRSSKAAKAGGPVSAAKVVKRRVPHHEVERKYRDGLNKQLERLRIAIPSVEDQEKVSKTEILVGAINYIKSLETTSERIQKEKDMLYTLIPR